MHLTHDGSGIYSVVVRMRAHYPRSLVSFTVCMPISWNMNHMHVGLRLDMYRLARTDCWQGKRMKYYVAGRVALSPLSVEGATRNDVAPK